MSATTIRLSQTAVRHFVAIVDPEMTDQEAREVLREEVDEAEALPEKAFSGDAFWSLKGTGLRAIVRETADGPLAVAVVRARPRVYAVHNEVEPFVAQPDRPSIKERRAAKIAEEARIARERKAAQKEARRVAHEERERKLKEEREAKRAAAPTETPLTSLLNAQQPRNDAADTHYRKLVSIARRIVRLGERRPDDEEVAAICGLVRHELPAADLADLYSAKALKRMRQALSRADRVKDLESRLSVALAKIAELEAK